MPQKLLISKVTTYGIGVLYSKARGAELIETRPPGQGWTISPWWLFHADLYEDYNIFPGTRSIYPNLPKPTYHDVSGYIDHRIRHWQAINQTTDPRKAAVLARVFAWKPTC